MTSYIISCIFQEQTKIFCDNVCEQDCYWSSVEKQHWKSEKSLKTSKSCYENFSVNTIINDALQTVEIIKRNQCIIYGMIEFHHNTKLALLTLDFSAKIAGNLSRAGDLPK